MRAKRQEPEDMQIQVDAWECDLLRPVHPRDRLCVSCDPETVARVLQYIRGHAFSEHLLNHHNKAREGILKKGQNFQIRSISMDGEAKWKKFETLEEALLQTHGG